MQIPKIATVQFDKIETREIFRGKRHLSIFFPASGTDISDFPLFIRYLTKHSDIIGIQKGYFGLYNKGLRNQYNPSTFARKFLSYYRDTISKYEMVWLFSQSIGAIPALYIKRRVNNSFYMSFSPALSEKKLNYTSLLRPVLRALLFTVTGRYLLEIAHEKSMRRFIENILRIVAYDTVRPIRRVGTKSYLHALNTVYRFGSIPVAHIDKRSLLVLGKNDSFVKSFCSFDHLRKRGRLIEINGGHSLLQKNWKDARKIIDSFIKSHSILS